MKAKDKNKPSVFDVGYLGHGPHKTRIGGTRVKASADWENMLARCYYEKTARYCSYGAKGVTVYSEWLNYQNFAEWHNENYIEGYYLDKDILGWNDKQYRSDVCVFVPREINNLLVHKNKADCMFGVEVSHKRFRARFKYKDIGYFDTQIEAHNAYKEVKLDHIYKTARKYFYSGQIDERVYLALIQFDINENGFVV